MESSTSKLSARERLSATVKAARGETGSATGRIGSSVLVSRLASRLGLKPNDLALRMTEDTVRRTKYPVLEKTDADGKTTYTHPVQIHEGPMSR